MAMNKTVFEKEWKVIRSHSTVRWSLIADYDLVRVDKAEGKFDKFVTLLQVKYGYTRQQARDEIALYWKSYEAKERVLARA